MHATGLSFMQAMEERSEHLDEALLSNAYAWMRKASEDRLEGRLQLWRVHASPILLQERARCCCHAANRETSAPHTWPMQDVTMLTCHGAARVLTKVGGCTCKLCALFEHSRNAI